MASESKLSRRHFLGIGLICAGALPLAAPARAAGDPLLKPDEPEAKKVKYIEDASSVKEVPPGNNCANCALYEGSYGSASGPCQLFPGRQVQAKGWCSSWSPQM